MGSVGVGCGSPDEEQQTEGSGPLPPPAVCVTGSTGYVGSWLVRTLLRRGYRVHATARDTGMYVCTHGARACVRWRCTWPNSDVGADHGRALMPAALRARCTGAGGVARTQARPCRCSPSWKKGGTGSGCSGPTWARKGASTPPSRDAWRSSTSRPPWTSTYHPPIRTTSVSRCELVIQIHHVKLSTAAASSVHSIRSAQMHAPSHKY
jgi:hypothetical protein